MALDAATIRQLYATNAGRRYLDDLAAQGVVLPGVRSGGMTALPPGTELLRSRPVLVGPATQATAPTEGFNVGQGDGGMPRPLFPGDLPMIDDAKGMDPTAPAPSMDLSNGMLSMDPTAPKPASDPFEGSILAGMDVGGKSPISTQSGFTPESLTRPAEPAEAGGMGGGLWDRVKGFFEPDEPLTAEEQYDEDVSGAGWAGAAQAASQAASDYRSSPLQVLTAALGGYGVAKQRAKGDLKKEAREEEEFGLKKQALQSEITGREQTNRREDLRFQREDMVLQRADEAIEGLPDGELRNRARTLRDLGQIDEVAKLLNPDPTKYEIVGDSESGRFAVNPLDPTDIKQVMQGVPKPTAPFGNETIGYYQTGPNGPVQVVPGLGREPKEGPVTYQTLAPNEVAALGYPAGTVVQRSSRGEIKADRPGGGGATFGTPLDPSEVAALGYPAGTVVQRSSTGELREYNPPGKSEGASIGTPSGATPRLLELNQRVIDAGRNFGVLNPREQSEYRYLLAQEAAPKQSLDPGTGQTITIPSDVSMFVKPPPLEDGDAIPSLMELPAPAPGAPPSGLPIVGGGGPGSPILPQPPGPPPGVPVTSAMAPMPAPAQVPFNPPPSPTRVQGATKQQIEDYTKANKAVGTLKIATNRARELLKAQGGAPFVGAAASQMEVVLNQIVTALGQQSDAGTMQPSDIERYKGMVGDPTSLMGYLSNATGLRSFEAVINEMDSQAEQGMFKKAIDAGQSSIRTSDGRQVPVYTSDEAMNKALPTLKKGDQVITPDGRLMEVP